MREFRKNIILLPMEYNGVNNLKGILSVQCEQQLKCNVKCYNLKLTDEQFLLGIMVNEQIFKTSVMVSELSNLTYIVPCKVKPNDHISCVLLSLNNEGYEILLWGSTETTKAWQNTAICCLEQNLYNEKLEGKENNSNNKSLNSVNQQSFMNEEQIDEYEKEQIEQEKYIDKIVQLTNVDEDESDELNKEDYNKSEYNTNNQEIFFNRVQNQVFDLLSKNEPDQLLEDIIPGGKFCKVKLEDSYYVFGVIYQDEVARYLCYGIPSNGNLNPPKELEGFCQWLPIDVNNEMGSGYWISYQDAFSGENIKVEVIS